MIPPRGTVGGATDPFGDTSRRPFVLVSDTTTGHPPSRERMYRGRRDNNAARQWRGNLSGVC